MSEGKQYLMSYLRFKIAECNNLMKVARKQRDKIRESSLDFAHIRLCLRLNALITAQDGR